ncbi:30S ribosomal protein S18 [Candidatus Gracilibacteria bacterium]|nr:30S ribosomal protein S18 [Candidatus Gracilibacteria bacterium]
MPKFKNRQCHFTKEGIKFIDYKNTDLLNKFITKYRKITPSYYSGTSLKSQKELASAIKRARYMALIPYTT